MVALEFSLFLISFSSSLTYLLLSFISASIAEALFFIAASLFLASVISFSTV
jgi:hypothetical protein